MSSPRNMFIQSQCNELLHLAVRLFRRPSTSDTMVPTLLSLLVAAIDRNAMARTLLSKAQAAKIVLDAVLCSQFPCQAAASQTALHNAVTVIQGCCMEGLEARHVVSTILQQLQKPCPGSLAAHLLAALASLVGEFPDAAEHLRRRNGLRVLLTLDCGDDVTNAATVAGQMSILAALRAAYSSDHGHSGSTAGEGQLHEMRGLESAGPRSANSEPTSRTLQPSTAPESRIDGAADGSVEAQGALALGSGCADGSSIALSPAAAFEKYGVELDSFDLDLLANATGEVNEPYIPPQRRQSHERQSQASHHSISSESERSRQCKRKLSDNARAELANRLPIDVDAPSVIDEGDEDSRQGQVKKRRLRNEVERIQYPAPIHRSHSLPAGVQWSETQVEALLHGVERYGQRWEDIKLMFAVLQGRTGADIYVMVLNGSSSTEPLEERRCPETGFSLSPDYVEFRGVGFDRKELQRRRLTRSNQMLCRIHEVRGRVVHHGIRLSRIAIAARRLHRGDNLELHSNRVDTVAQRRYVLLQPLVRAPTC
eukprot:m.40296 g.40296  ORF g.40296 m.40296 type:complete len:540 (-) comp8060_c0_seq1:2769-4388(-)